MSPQYEDQFRNWVFPLGPEDFINRTVLDAGCGMGRNSYWAIKWGAKSVVAFDYGKDSVESAKKNLAEFPNARVDFESIYNIKYENEFDIAMSIGVIHHLEDPKLAISNLMKSLRPNGTLVVWVYGKEGYGKWITIFIDPLRKHLTSRLPIQFVHLLSYFISISFWIFIKIFQGPGKHFKQLSTFPFWHVHSIVFDHLLPEVANYWDKSEVLALCDETICKKIKVIKPPHNWGWTLIAVKNDN
jgi:SAM-dependent methyltransferase